jgi:hypothetical protein
MASKIERRRVSYKVINTIRKRTGRKALRNANRDIGARWPGLTLPLVASLSALAAFKYPGDSAPLKLLRGAMTAGAMASWATQLFVRPWQLAWGATDTELRHHMPGDALVEHPWLEATRAITIDAPARAIWPSLRELDVLPAALRGQRTIEQVEHQRTVVLSIREGDKPLATASMHLEVLSEEHTRLVIRLRVAAPLVARMLLAYVLVDRDFARTREQMLGIKQRAEAAWLQATPQEHLAHPIQSPAEPEEGIQAALLRPMDATSGDGA